MIIDTCVWVEHVHREIALVRHLCDRSRAVAHPDVLGEILLGCGDERRQLAARLRFLETLVRPPQDVLEQVVMQHAIACRRVGWVDAVLLATALTDPSRPAILTFDRKLLREAIRLGVAFAA